MRVYIWFKQWLFRRMFVVTIEETLHWYQRPAIWKFTKLLWDFTEPPIFGWLKLHTSKCSSCLLNCTSWFIDNLPKIILHSMKTTSTLGPPPLLLRKTNATIIIDWKMSALICDQTAVKSYSWHTAWNMPLTSKVYSSDLSAIPCSNVWGKLCKCCSQNYSSRLRKLKCSSLSVPWQQNTSKIMDNLRAVRCDINICEIIFTKRFVHQMGTCIASVSRVNLTS